MSAHRQDSEYGPLGGATDAAKDIARKAAQGLAQPYTDPPVAVIERYGSMLDVRCTDGRRFVIIVAELPS